MAAIMNGLKAIAVYVFVFNALIFILAYPVNPTINYDFAMGQQPSFSNQFELDEYKANLKDFYTSIFKDQSLGQTRFEGITVEEEMKKYFPKSAKIIIVAFLISSIVGILKGIFDFRFRHSKLNFLGNGSTWLLQSIPDYFILLSVQWMAIKLIPDFRIFSNATWYNFIVIGMIVAIYPTLYIARITAAALVNESGHPYIQVVRSKGIKEKRIIFYHMLKNGMRTIIAHITSLTVYILSSLIMAEYLLGYEGIALRMFSSFELVKVFSGSVREFEPGMILGAAVCFMGTVMVSQLLAFTIKKILKLDRSLANEQ